MAVYIDDKRSKIKKFRRGKIRRWSYGIRNSKQISLKYLLQIFLQQRGSEIEEWFKSNLFKLNENKC